MSSGACSPATTESVSVTVNPTSVAGTISGAATVCTGTNSTTLTLTGSTGAIQWQSASPLATSTYSNITGATSATYTASNLTATTFYKAVVTSGVCPAATTTAAVGVTVSPIAVATAITGGGSTCFGTVKVLTLSTGYVGSIQWQTSTNNVNFTNISAATAATYSVAATTVAGTYYYRAVLSSGACSPATTASVSVTVSPKPVAKPITANTTTPSGATSALALCRDDLNARKTFMIGTGYVGSIQWQTVVSTATTAPTTGWTDIVGATNSTYTVGYVPPVGGNYFRVKFSSSPCSPDVFSAPFVVWYKDCGVVRVVTPEEIVSTDVKTPFDVKAYPNPYTETFNLSLTTSSEDKVGIVVYDMTGRLIERREVRPSDMVEQQIGDRYPSGVYNIVVTQGEEVKTLRVIKR